VSDIPKTAIIMPFGLFEYLFTPFGLSHGAQTFQRMMGPITDGPEGVFAYMDDSRVGSPDRQTHPCHLQCCGSEMKIFFGSRSYFGLNFGSGLFMKNTFEMQII
jgi:hypothetical protein